MGGTIALGESMTEKKVVQMFKVITLYLNNDDTIVGQPHTGLHMLKDCMHAQKGQVNNNSLSGAWQAHLSRTHCAHTANKETVRMENM